MRRGSRPPDMNGSGGREAETRPMELFRKAAERTHPILVLIVLLFSAVVVLGVLFVYAGPIVAPLILLALAILVALVLEVYEQAVARGWL